MQQIQALLFKRLIIFGRRYILALIIVLVPVLLSIIICILITPSLILDNARQSTPKNARLKSLKFDISNYGAQEIPYYTSNLNPAHPLNQLLFKIYNYQNRPKIYLYRPNEPILDYVFRKHNQSLNSLVGEYFTGQQWIVPDKNQDPLDINSYEITLFYSKLAYHSSAAGLNEITNILLGLLSSNQINKTISTINAPLPHSKDTQYIEDDFLKYLGCFDILPLSIFNFSVSILYAFVISLNVMHVAKEKLNESKKMQLITNTSYLTYWLSNYLFDFFLCFLNIIFFLACIAIISQVRDDIELDIYLLSSWPYLLYLFLILFLSALSWPLLSYCWLHFFESDVTAFVVLLIVLGIGAFCDVFLSFVQIFAHITNEGLVFESFGSLIFYILRMIIAIICPNVTIKRILFDFRLRSSHYCMNTLNRIMKTNYDIDASFLSLNEPGIGIFFTFLVFQLVFSVVFLIAIETDSLSKNLIKDLFSCFRKSSRVSSTKNLMVNLHSE